MKLRAAVVGTILGLGALFTSTPAQAGGFDELPDQGAQALGRGAAFTAKADDATAIYYNVAGLARQRGTKLQVSTNVHFNSMTFQRAGNYADDPKDPATPYGGTKYPLVRDKNASFTLPMLAASSDFGFDRLTFGLGVFGPAATGRTFQLGVNGKPSPARYDFVQSNSTILFPTLGAAYRVTDRLDLGLAGHLAVANLDELSIAYADAGGTACKNAEYRPCDAEGRLQAKGIGAGASVAAMYHLDSVQLGLQVRSPMSIGATGTTTAKIGGQASAPSQASTTIDLPWIVRAGVRYVELERSAYGSRELWDAELDATYEAWGAAQGVGPQVATTDVTTGAPMTITSVHHWKDTFSLRAGGAYNHAIDGDRTNILTVRAGAFYDSPTTDSAYTRLDTNTLAKVAGTAGVGFAHGAFAVNLAYAAVASLSRTVTDGEIRPVNGAKGGATVDGNGQPLPAVNNGVYTAFSHVVSVSVEVNFETLFWERQSEPELEAKRTAKR